MSDINPFQIEEVCDLWQNFCELHSKLYELTCEEYKVLLESDLDSLENILNLKTNLIETIKSSEEYRKSLLFEISNKRIDTCSELLEFLEINNFSKQKIRIEKLNLILIDIITSIQDQNKKNQIFLNKAMISLRELKNSFMGKKNYKTYNRSGLTQTPR